MRSRKVKSDPNLIRTSGEVFPDGTQLALVRPTGSSGPALLFWDGAGCKIAPTFERHGHVYTPVALDPSVSRCLRLPADVQPYGSDQQLISAIAAVFKERTTITNEASRALAF